MLSFASSMSCSVREIQILHFFMHFWRSSEERGGVGGIKGRSELLRKFIQNGAWRVRAENTFYFYIEPFGLIGSVKK